MGGLFTKESISTGRILAQYVGKEYYPPSSADSVENQQYMFSARSAQDGRKRIIIDGNPVLYKNLAGFANYAEGKAANAHFVDRSKDAPPETKTNILLVASERIPQGTEIRVDYDMGSSAHPFRDQMVDSGVPLRILRSSEYKKETWAYPQSV